MASNVGLPVLVLGQPPMASRKYSLNNSTEVHIVDTHSVIETADRLCKGAPR